MGVCLLILSHVAHPKAVMEIVIDKSYLQGASPDKIHCLVDVSEQFAISLTLSRTAWNRRAFSPIAPFFRFMNDDFEFPEITSLISFKSSCVNMNVSPRSITPVLRVSCVTSQNSNAPSGHASLKFCAIPVSFVASAPQRVPNKVY